MVTASMVGRHPSGSWASRRITVSRTVPYTAAATAPLVRFHDPAGEHGAVELETLASHLESEPVKTTERGQISAREPSIRARRDGSVRHVEVFRDERVGAFILGKPRHLSGQRRAAALNRRPHPHL